MSFLESGDAAAAGRRRGLALVLVAAGVALLAAAWVRTFSAAEVGAAQAGALARAQSQSLRLAAAVGPPASAAELRDSSAALLREVTALDAGAALRGRAEKLPPAAAELLARQAAQAAARAPFDALAASAPQLVQAADALAALRLQQGAGAAEVALLARLARGADHVGPAARAVFGPGGADADAALRLEGELTALRDDADLLAAGQTEPRVPPLKDPQALQRLQALQGLVEAARVQAVLPPPEALDAAPVRTRLRAENDALRQALTALPGAPPVSGAGGRPDPLALGGLAGAALLAGAGLALLLRGAARERSALARRLDEQQRQAQALAEAQAAAEDERDRLAAELQALAAADTARQAAAGDRSRSLREGSQALQALAARIESLAARARQGEQAAQLALQAGDEGLAAVRRTGEGIQALRGQVQDSAKRIKRLGESSQEIGEITGLIADITERTHVLALNAAIQAASAGEAGRGFSVVAEEVQRLAVRSADAARRMAALIELLRTDTQDAAGAMERSTQGVLDGARLSEAGAAALAEIQRLTGELSQQVAGLATQSAQDAEAATRLVAGLRAAAEG